MKLERNESCICSSGKKNKKCCDLKEISDEDFIKLLHKNSENSLSFNENLLLESIKTLEMYLTYSHLSKENRYQIQLNLISSYQSRGLHTEALKIVSVVEKRELKTDSHLFTYIYLLKSKSLSALEDFENGTKTLDIVIGNMLAAIDNSQGYGMLLVEASKIYINGNQIKKGKECIVRAIDILKNDKNEVEHYERAKSNQAILMLHDSDNEIVEEGVKRINDSIYKKSETGDLEGLGTNYCNLGLHYWRTKDYKGAIAYLRKDLWITRQIGDLHSTAISLRNLASLYLDLNQFKKAKKLAIESIEIGNQINDLAIIEKANHQLDQIKDASRIAGIAKVAVGERALCMCGSGDKYEDCCGIADHEPIDFPFRFSGVSEELQTITSKFKQPSKLDFIFRDTEVSSSRLAWNQIEIKNGWYKLSELPDMANIYLLSAKEILENNETNTDSIHSPLSCLILSVSALEAYINQVAYFLDDVQKYPESILHNLPQEFENGVTDFQRNTELTLKWNILGKCICEEMWSPSQILWDNFKILISIRNEFIHFKLSDYEQVIPVPKDQHYLLKRLPKSVETRKVFHSWPMRILTQSFAKWSVEIAEEMLKYFKQQYEAKRIKST